MSATAIWRDWSCDVRVCVRDARMLVLAQTVVTDLMGDVEQTVSRFRPDTELNHVNTTAGQLTPVSSLTLELVRDALKWASYTDGALDPTIGRHVIAAGYDKDIEKLRHRMFAQTLLTEPVRRAHYQQVRVDVDLRLVGVPAGLALDLGATAKAWTADEATRRIQHRFGTPAVVEIGGDVAAAGDHSWRISICERSGDPGQVVALDRGGIATSSTAARRWRTRTGSGHHIIDPRTGKPSNGPWRTATVWAPSAVQANAASTAALVWGDEASARLDALGLDVRLVDTHGNIEAVGSWPLPDLVA